MKIKWTLILSGLLMELCYIFYRLIDVNPAQTVIKYMVVFAGAFIMMVVSFRLLKNQDFSRFFFLTVLLFSLFFGLTLVSSPPGQSDDIYRYLWDGKLQYHGISPYSYAPDDPALKQYHSEQLPKLVNFPHIKTIYPPAAQLFFRLSYTLFGESIPGMKFLFLLTTLGSICFFYLILKQKGAETRWLLFFAWNPLVIMETAVNGHLDILMVFFLLMSLWGVAPPTYSRSARCRSFRGFISKVCQKNKVSESINKSKLIFSGISLACAVLSKLIPVILLPVFFLYFLPLLRGVAAKRTGCVGFVSLSSVSSVANKNIFTFFIPLLLTITTFYAFYIESAQNMFLTAINYSSKWYFNNPLFLGIFSIFRDNAAAHVVSFLLFIVLYILILLGPFELDKKIVFALGVFVICNPTIHPWYLVILLGLLCIHRSVIVVLWSGLVIVSYIVVYDFKLTGTWQDSWFLMGIEYLPLVILLVIQWYRGRLKNALV
jgi:alpha-1,6-mannosyltransferase